MYQMFSHLTMNSNIEFGEKEIILLMTVIVFLVTQLFFDLILINYDFDLGSFASPSSMVIDGGFLV